MTQPLAQRLRDETRPLHTRAERAGLMPALLRGSLPRPAYAALLQQLQALYGALEPALAAHADHPWLAGWPLPALRRGPALAADLAELADQADAEPLAPPGSLARPADRADPSPATPPRASPVTSPPTIGAAPAARTVLLPATQALCDRIAELARAPGPGLLLAHAYVRYLGDLSGGQVVARQVQAAYGLAPGEGTRFYDFGPPETAAALLACCRQALASTDADAAACDALVAEACWSFTRHAELFEQLAAAPAA